MASSSRIKTADRQAILKKLLPLLKKQYHKIPVPKLDRPVMETMLYAICLEDSTVEQADESFARFTRMFPDLNEARVSSIAELEPVFANLDGIDWRAFRTRAVLQYVFDKTYNFEFESLRKKTLDLATKQLAKIKHLSPFVRSYTLQQVVGAHVLPIDETSSNFLIWMGLAQPDQAGDELGESLKSLVRKAESHQFSFSIRCAAADPAIKAAFDPKQYTPPEDGHDPATSIDRLTLLFKQGLSSVKSSAAAPASKAKSAKPKVEKTEKPEKVEKTEIADTRPAAAAKSKPAASTAAAAAPPASAPAASTPASRKPASQSAAKPASAKAKTAPKKPSPKK